MGKRSGPWQGSSRVPGSEPGNITQVTAAELAGIPEPPSVVAPSLRMSDKEVASNLAIRCPSCSGVGELKWNEVLLKYAVVCRTHGRYTKWIVRNVDCLTAPVFNREQLRAMKE